MSIGTARCLGGRRRRRRRRHGRPFQQAFLGMASPKGFARVKLVHGGRRNRFSIPFLPVGIGDPVNILCGFLVPHRIQGVDDRRVIVVVLVIRPRTRSPLTRIRTSITSATTAAFCLDRVR